LLVNFIGVGLGLSDDSYYIIQAQKPENISGSITQFGYYTRWPYLAAGQDIKWFRIHGVLILLSTSSVFSFFFHRYVVERNLEYPDIFSSSCLLLGSGLAFYFWRWYPSPSYNWLNLIACLLIGSALLAFTLPQLKKKFFLTGSALILGLGFGFTFLAKPTSTVLLFFSVVWWLWLNWSRKTGVYFVGVATASLISLIAWHIWGELGGLSIFSQNLALGFTYSEVLQSRHGLLQICLRAIFGVSSAVASGMLLWFVFSKLCKAKVSQRKFHDRDESIRHRLFLTISITSISLLAIMWIDPGSILAATYVALIPVYAVIYLFELPQTSLALDVPGKTWLWNKLAPVMLLLSLSFSYGLGSSLGFSNIMTGAQIFLASACLFIAWLIDKQCSTRDFSNVTCLFIIASLILLVYSEIKQPCRLSSSLNEQSITVDFYQSYNSLKVDPLTAEYAGNLTGLAAAGNWQAQTPLIDMTGATPAHL